MLPQRYQHLQVTSPSTLTRYQFQTQLATLPIYIGLNYLFILHLDLGLAGCAISWTILTLVNSVLLIVRMKVVCCISLDGFERPEGLGALQESLSEAHMEVSESCGTDRGNPAAGMDLL